MMLEVQFTYQQDIFKHSLDCSMRSLRKHDTRITPFGSTAGVATEPVESFRGKNDMTLRFPCKESVTQGIAIRNIEREELQDILRVEDEAWPSCMKATPSQYLSRLHMFKDGLFGAYLDGRLIGVSSSQIVRWPVGDLRWEEITGHGYIHTHTPGGSALYLVSLGISKTFQSRGAGHLLVEAQKRLATQRGLRYVVSGSRISEYRSFKNRYSGISVNDYVSHRRPDGELYDAAQRFFSRCGFKPIKIVRGYVDAGDADSEDNNVIVAWANRQ